MARRIAYRRWPASLRVAVVAVGLLLSAVARGSVSLEVADPYIELHTGPASGYPITQIIERGESVEILKRRTDWFLIRAEDGREGWVPLAQIQRTVTTAGEAAPIEDPGQADYQRHRWSMGVMGGDFGGARTVSFYAGWRLTENIAAEVSVSQALGRYSSNRMARVSLQHQLFPEWRVSPFFSLGLGAIETDPSATLVQAADRRDELAQAGLGVQMHLRRNFFLRAEYNSYVVITTRDENEEINEWKAGLGFFF